MSRLQILLVTFVSALLLSVGAGAGAWYYMYGGPEVSAAQLVPANTIAFATIPNGAAIFESYQTSQAKQLAISPNMKPLHDEIIQLLGPKNADLIHTFMPNLSGQSFIAITQFDIDHPDNVGFIAGMKPKAGLGDFGAFLDKLKAAYGDELKAAKTGKGNVAGHDYDWIQAPGVPQKICVANISGWIITAFGEASLQDWIERFEKHSTTSSLADNGDYRSSVSRVGESPEALAYFNYHTVLDILQKQMVKGDPKMADYFAKKFKDIGGLAAGTSFENGQLVDRYSFNMPRQAQLDAGMSADPCPFETLKFTSRDTRFYTATAFNWKQYYANIKEQMDAESGGSGPAPTKMVDDYLKSFTQDTGVDVQHNIIEALGPEISVQAEWNEGMNFPEIGFFAKLAKPDDFKPVISAILTAVRKQFATTAVVKEMNVAGQNFATLNFVPIGMISPTITEDGPYFGIFLTANQAARSFQRDPALTLAANDNFKQQIGDQRNGAQQIIYLDSPFMLNRAYKLAVPYLSMAAMFNKDVANAMQGHQLPDDLTWLAPMGTWSCVVKNDATGMQGYSISGVGNQGIFLTFLGGAGLGAAQSYGLLDKVAALTGAAGMGGNPMGAPSAPTPGAAAAGAPDVDQTNAAPAAATAPTPAPDASSAPAPAPATTPTNATPSSPATNQ
jgi:hypothetical protein